MGPGSLTGPPSRDQRDLGNHREKDEKLGKGGRRVVIAEELLWSADRARHELICSYLAFTILVLVVVVLIIMLSSSSSLYKQSQTAQTLGGRMSLWPRVCVCHQALASGPKFFFFFGSPEE